MENSQMLQKGLTFVFCFAHDFLHTDLVRVPILSQLSSNFAHYFQEEMNAIFFALRMLEVGSKYHAMQPGVGRRSCALAWQKA